MPVFPSLEWFNAAQESVNQDSRFRSLGSCDASMGVKVGDEVFLVSFEGFECAKVDEISEDTLYDADFYIDMTTQEWKAFLDNVKANGGADSSHTLNSMDLAHPQGIVKSNEPQREVLFLRYHLSMQAFFDSAAQIETTFA